MFYAPGGTEMLKGSREKCWPEKNEWLSSAAIWSGDYKMHREIAVELGWGLEGLCICSVWQKWMKNDRCDVVFLNQSLSLKAQQKKIGLPYWHRSLALWGWIPDSSKMSDSLKHNLLQHTTCLKLQPEKGRRGYFYPPPWDVKTKTCH